MNDLDARFNRRLCWLVAASLLLFSWVTVLQVGAEAVNSSTTDSAGRQMGFNDPLSNEHYLIMAQNFRLTRFFTRDYAYAWVLLAAHGIGLGLLLRGGRVSSRLTRGFFVAQALVFPWGLPLLPFLLVAFALHPNGSSDREFWVDSPAIMFLSAPPWVGVALFVAWKLRGEKLGLGRLAGQLVARFRRSPANGLPPASRTPEGLSSSRTALA